MAGFGVLESEYASYRTVAVVVVVLLLVVVVVVWHGKKTGQGSMRNSCDFRMSRWPRAEWSDWLNVFLF
jgi:hypothetical protein